VHIVGFIIIIRTLWSVLIKRLDYVLRIFRDRYSFFFLPFYL